MSKLRLIADIGGTNARFALVNNTQIIGGTADSLRCGDFSSLFSAVDHYLKHQQITGDITEAVFAVAGPIHNDEVVMTNQSWSFSTEQISQLLQIPRVRLLNDFEAIAQSLPWLQASDYRQVGTQKIDPSRPLCVMGPGTGMGVALCIPGASGATCLATEGGHAGLAPHTELEQQLFSHLLQQRQTISRELLLCGPGLLRIYQSLGAIRGQTAELASASEIQYQAVKGACSLAQQALATFCGLLGSAAGDQALNTGSIGGLFIAGGIVPRFIDFLQASEFRSRFDHKPPMSDYMQGIGTAVISCDNPGLIGCAQFLMPD
jgi:glucokinase